MADDEPVAPRVGRPARFPTDGKRLVIFTLFDRRGRVDDVALHALQGLRKHAAELHVVVNGELGSDGRERLEAVADQVVHRENSGLDVGAQQEALQVLGSGIDRFDEVVLCNDTWYGPIGSFTRLFERMDAQAVDFWGMTAHGSHEGLPRHVQSYWIAARRAMTTTGTWSDYWAKLARFEGYWEAVYGHELAFTDHFESAGFVSAVAFPETEYPPGNAAILAPAQLIADGCPVLKKRVFFHDPVVLARRGVIGAHVAAAAVDAGYPAPLLWAHLARTVAPGVLNASCALVEVLPRAASHLKEGDRRTLVIAHLGHAEGVPSLAARLKEIPGRWDLVQTVDPGSDGAGSFPGAESVSIRVDDTGDASGVIAFFNACAELPLEDWDLVLAVRAPAVGAALPSAERARDRFALDALVGDRQTVAELFALFDEAPELGLVFPVAGVLGREDWDSAWGAERILVETLRDVCGIGVPWDLEWPLEPTESMWAVRPAALRPLVDVLVQTALAGASAADRARALRRCLSSAVGESGSLTRTVIGSGDLRTSLALRVFQAENGAAREYSASVSPVDVVDGSDRQMSMPEGSGPGPRLRRLLGRWRSPLSHRSSE